VDPPRYRAFERAARLRFRRGAVDFEHARGLVALSNELERSLLPGVSTDAAAQFVADLYAAAAPFESSAPRQCIAIIGYDYEQVASRSEEAVKALDDALRHLISAPRTVSPRIDEVDTDFARLPEVPASRVDPLKWQALTTSDVRTPARTCAMQLWFLSEILQLDSTAVAKIGRAMRVD
jgi:hypothetical protein